MYRIAVILNLLVSSISIAKPIEETSLASPLKTKDEHTNIAIARYSDRTDHYSFMTVSNDDLLRTSDIIKVYKSEENEIAKTRNLKEQPENDLYEKAELKNESRTSKDSKPDNVIATPEEKISGPAKEEVESKAASKEESKTVEVTSESTKSKGSETTLISESKSSNYLENDKVEDDVANAKIALDEESKRRSLEMNNDESNSAWDVLDDISSRRMFSRPDNLNIMSKAKPDNTQVELTQVRIAQKPNFEPSKDHSYGSIRTPAKIQLPHTVFPQQRFPLPLITIHTAVPIDFRRLLSEERSKLLNENKLNEINERTEISSELDSNAYPYTPPAEETPKISQVPANSIITKLAQASEHAQKPRQYYSGENSNIILGLPYYNIKPTYFIPTNYDAYKYITGYGRIF